MHAKALALHMKAESKCMQLKAEYENNMRGMRAKEAALEAERENAREMSERTAKQVERLRRTSRGGKRS